MNYDLTEGSIVKNLLKFAFPLMIGNLLQQFYNVADTLIVGRFIGENALAAVGSSYTFMVFLTSILLGLCMGSGAFLSIQFGRKAMDTMKQGIFISFVFIGIVALGLNALVYVGLDGILWFMRIPADITGMMKEYLRYIFLGIMAVFLYNYFANLLRAMGNSLVPLLFLGVSAVLNIGLDLFFVVKLTMGVGGAAIATVISQYFSGVGLFLFYRIKCSKLHTESCHRHWDKAIFREITGLSVMTCFQQSIMNFGILMVQGLVNSFGTVVMAAFAAAVKIDSFAYSPVQDFGNAFSTYIAQNYGAGKKERIRRGMKTAVLMTFVFCSAISLCVCLFAEPLLRLFIEKESVDVLAVGVRYLQIEGAFYFGIGLLFLLYGFYRAVEKPGISVVLTVISLGTRVLLAYTLAAVPQIGVIGIWAAVPVGWALADLTGVLYMRKVMYSL